MQSGAFIVVENRAREAETTPLAVRLLPSVAANRRLGAEGNDPAAIPGAYFRRLSSEEMGTAL
jgi:hypothetical protein